MASVQPFDIARVYQQIEKGSRGIGNLEAQRKLKTSKFVGEETEIAQDKMREIESSIQKILGKGGGGGGAAQAMGTAAMFMNPLAGALVTGISSLVGGRSQKKRAERAIKKAGLELGKLPSKYEKSWMGKTVKDFTSGYENQFSQMKQNLPSSGDIFKNALMSGVGSYLTAGGKGEMDRLRDLSGNVGQKFGGAGGMFAGGLDLGATGQGTALFGGKDSLLQKFFSGDENTFKNMTQTQKMQIGKILQMFKLN